MGYITARQTFENVKKSTDDKALQDLADGLIQLSRAIEEDLKKVKHK